jgi:hypothetical protein
VGCEKTKTYKIWMYYEYASFKIFEKLLNSVFFGFSIFHQIDVLSTELFFYNFTYFVNIYIPFLFLFAGISGHVSIHPGP